MYDNQNARAIAKWLEFSVHGLNTILYPINKFAKYKDHAAQIATDATDVFDRRSSFAIDAKTMDAIAKDSKGISPGKVTIDIIGGVSLIIENIVFYWRILSFIRTYIELNDQSNEVSFLGINIRKKHLHNIQIALVGIAIFSLIGYLLYRVKIDKFTQSETFKKIREKIDMVMGVICAGIGFFLLLKLVYDLFNGRKMTLGYWTSASMGMVLSSSFFDINPIEKRLAKNPKVYAITTGTFTVLRGINAGLNLFRKNEVGFRLNQKSKVEPNQNALFVYFCGPDEPTTEQHSCFLENVSAKHHIYVAGIGATTYEYKQVYSNQLIPTVNKLDNYTNAYSYKDAKRNVTFIERYNEGTVATGFRKKDIEIIATKTLEAVSKVLTESENIDRVIFAGHSKGASVALTACLFKMEKDVKLIERLGKCNTSSFFFDPVECQDEKVDFIDSSWTSAKLYDSLTAKLTGKIQFIELYSRAAHVPDFFSFSKWINFDPAKRFLYNPTNSDTKLFRGLVGYTHQGMISNYYDFTESYTKNNQPTVVKLVTDFVNDTIQLDWSKSDAFTSHTSKYASIFKKSDDIMLNKTPSPKQRKEEYENNAQEKVNFIAFINLYGKLPV